MHIHHYVTVFVTTHFYQSSYDTRIGCNNSGNWAPAKRGSQAGATADDCKSTSCLARQVPVHAELYTPPVGLDIAMLASVAITWLNLLRISRSNWR